MPNWDCPLGDWSHHADGAGLDLDDVIARVSDHLASHPHPLLLERLAPMQADPYAHVQEMARQLASAAAALSTTKGRALTLKKVRALRMPLHELTVAAVDLDLSRGRTWTDIGRTLGITAADAEARYSVNSSSPSSTGTGATTSARAEP